MTPRGDGPRLLRGGGWNGALAVGRPGRAHTHLVGGDDPLARVLEQLLVVPARVRGRQPLRAQVVVAEPQQAQRLHEGLAVPALRPERCTRGWAGHVSRGQVARVPPSPHTPWTLPLPASGCARPALPAPVLTVQPPRPALFRGRVRRGPHEQRGLRCPREGGVRPRRQLPPREAPQRVAPGVRGAIDGAAVQPARHSVGLRDGQGR